MPLEELLGFASRQNPKRGFLFLSKVLGKHVPCRPFRMREIYDRLAGELRTLAGPVAVIGMAETATGLGGGVADSLVKETGREDVLYLHTTRHRLDVPALIAFDECHSHAPDHILYAPLGKWAGLFQRTRNLVLVDDEISTGRTLRLLAERVAAHLPGLRQIVLVSIVNWLAPSQRHWIENFGKPVRFASLLEGGFEFTLDPGYQPVPPPRLAAVRRSRYARADTGRTGLFPAAEQRLPAGRVPSGPLVLVGTGEFAYQPFLVAERLEKKGYDVLFQSTTRSPIAEGDGIQRKLCFTDEHGEGVANYIYNLPTDRCVIAAYEHPALAAVHDFPALVDAEVWSLAPEPAQAVAG